MHGELAQLIALCAHGNAALTREGPPRPTDAPATLHEHSTFRFVGRVRFVRHGRRFGLVPTTRVVATSAESWFLDLATRGVAHLTLFRHPPPTAPAWFRPHMQAGFSGGVPVALAAWRRRATSEVWRAAWEVRDQGAADQRIWGVDYHGVAAAVPQDGRAPGVHDARDRLCRVLGDAAEYARGADWEGWATQFDRAAAHLDAPVPKIPYHGDLFPVSGYPLASRQLLAAVADGWVFGGMGSWNDVADDSDRYVEVTTALYDAILDAAVAAANAFDPRGAGAIS